MNFKGINNIDELIKRAGHLPYNFPKDELGYCMFATELITKKLLREGIDDFYVVEGYITFPEIEDNEESNRAHTWIEFHDGVVDETKDQFVKEGYDPNKIIYLEEHRKYYTSKEYLKLCEKYPEPLRED